MKPDGRETAEGILFTDEYQLTMAQVYFRQGLHARAVETWRRAPGISARPSCCRRRSGA